MPEVRIQEKDIVEIPRNPICHLVNLLIKKGVPLKILRKNLWDISDLKEDEIEFLKEVTHYRDVATMEYVYQF